MGALLVCVGAVLLLNLYAGVLVWARAVAFRVKLYRPMLLNIVLSLAPVVVAFVGFFLLLVVGGLANMTPDRYSWVIVVAFWGVLVVSTAVWILAFPNAAYLITELNMSHRKDSEPVPLWYDIVSVLTLTLSGLMNAVLSLGMIHTFALVLADTDQITWTSWAAALGVLTLGSLGIYLGRYLRFNSWDVRHPFGMLRKLGAYLRKPGKVLDAAGFIVTHTVLMAILYVPLFVLAHGTLMTAIR